MSKPIRLLVIPEAEGEGEIKSFRFSIPEVHGAFVSIPYDKAMVMIERIKAGGEFDSVDPDRHT